VIASYSQAPNAFNYQAILRNSDGTIKPSEIVSLQISIVNNIGTPVYLEIHNTVSSELGLVNLIIGEGTTSDDFSTVDWSNGPYFLEIIVNGVTLGASPLLSVPYALYADRAGDVFSGDYYDLSNKPTAISDFSMNANGQNISSLADPVNGQDAVTKAYVDSLKQEIMLEIYAELGLDDNDGNHYKAVKIGDQVWMAENLKASHYSDGMAIPLVESASAWDALVSTDKAYCWYDNNSSNGNTYGALYTWAAAMNGSGSSYTNPSGVQGVCPAGWHLPGDAEWKELEMYLGMSQAEASDTGYRGTDEGNKLKETGTTHWNSPNTGATNESGFTALPGGYHDNNGTFYYIGDYGYLWGATESSTILQYSHDLSRLRKSSQTRSFSGNL